MKDISIIIATFNSENVIEKCLESIFNQNFSNFELIIVDGKSSDNTLNRIEKYSHQIQKIISEPDNGIYDAWNKGLKLAEGKWIMFIGSDDELVSDCLQAYHNFITTNGLEDYDFISSKNELVDAKGNVVRVFGNAWQWRKFRRYNNVAHVGSLHNIKYFNQYGYFDPGYKISGDYEMLLRAKKQLRSSFLDKINARMGNGGVSFSNRAVFRECFDAKYKTGNISYFSCFIEDRYASFVFRTKKFLKKAKITS